jgi:hypothetical protein
MYQNVPRVLEVCHLGMIGGDAWFTRETMWPGILGPLAKFAQEQWKSNLGTQAIESNLFFVKSNANTGVLIPRVIRGLKKLPRYHWQRIDKMPKFITCPKTFFGGKKWLNLLGERGATRASASDLLREANTKLANWLISLQIPKIRVLVLKQIYRSLNNRPHGYRLCCFEHPRL